MNGLIPSLISNKFHQNCYHGKLRATSMFIDISGFSSMTQKLMKNGKEGAEVLADVINRIFSPAIRTIYEHGGFVASFAGDAFTSVFPSDAVSASCALASADRIRKLFHDERVQETKFGSFIISVRINLSHGTVAWGIIPHENQNVFHFGGQAIEKCTKNYDNTANGEVIFDHEILSQIPDSSDVIYDQISDRSYLLRSVASVEVELVSHIPASADQEDFVPLEVLRLNRRGEFRDIVSCYIAFKENRDANRAINRIISLAHGFGGYFNKVDLRNSGGVMLVLFGAPVNPGNLYNRALDFAIAVSQLPELSVRIGLAWGTVFAGFVGSELRSEYTALGSVVNLSARFAQSEESDFIYVNESIYRQCKHQYDIWKLEPRTFKGFESKIPIYELAGKGKETELSSFGESMIGRDRELMELSEILQPLKSGSFGGVAYVYGNPGIGKSRLVHELTKRQRIRTFLLQTDSILRKPLNPFTYFFRNYFNQDEELPLDERRESFSTAYQKLISRMVSVCGVNTGLEIIEELNRVKTVIGSVIGLTWEDSLLDTIDSRDRAVLTRLAVSEFFKAFSLIEPVIILVEDIQWMDEESRGVFEIMTRQVEKYPFIILATGRYNDDGSKPRLRLDDEVPCHEIELNDLSDDCTKLLIEDRIGGCAEDELASYIQARTQGNPFYTEQFCLYLKENGIISSPDGEYRLAGKPVDMPKDIKMILIARIDRLSEKLKEMVQIASVLGREFEVQVLSALVTFLHDVSSSAAAASLDGETLDIVSRIENEGIWSALTELKYIFNHSLLRDAAYDMQLRTRLRQLHRLAGDVIVRLHPDDMSFYADSAHHFQMAEVWDKAREYCTKAGNYFYDSLKYDESLSYRQKALSICLESLGEMHLDTARSYSELGVVSSDKGDFDAALIYHRKALAIRRELLGEKHPETAVSYTDLGEIFSEMGEYDNALANHEKAISIRREILGEIHPDTATSYNDIGAVYLDKNQLERALDHYQRALEIERETLSENHTSTACSYNNIGHVYSVKGDHDKALTYYEKALAIQKKILSEKHPHTATLYNNIASLYWKKKDYDTALEYSKKAHAMQKELLGEKHPSTARSYNNIGAIQSRMGNYGIALAYYEKALAIRLELLGERHRDTVNSYNNIGLSLRANGENAKALQYSEKALRVGRELYGNTHPNTAVFMGTVALIDTSLERYDEAEELYMQALEIFEDTLGEKHPNTVHTLKNMLNMFEMRGDSAKAEEIRSRLEQ